MEDVPHSVMEGTTEPNVDTAPLTQPSCLEEGRRWPDWPETSDVNILIPQGPALPLTNSTQVRKNDARSHLCIPDQRE